MEITDTDRLNWLQENCQTTFVSKNYTGEYLLDDYRQKYVLPTLLAVTCINSTLSLREAIDGHLEKLEPFKSF